MKKSLSENLLWKTRGVFWDYQTLLSPNILPCNEVNRVFDRIYSNLGDVKKTTLKEGTIDVSQTLFDYFFAAVPTPVKDSFDRTIVHFFVLFFPSEEQVTINTDWVDNVIATLSPLYDRIVLFDSAKDIPFAIDQYRQILDFDLSFIQYHVKRESSGVAIDRSYNGRLNPDVSKSAVKRMFLILSIAVALLIAYLIRGIQH